MTLRCLLLSGIWDTVFKNWLDKKPTVSDLIKRMWFKQQCAVFSRFGLIILLFAPLRLNFARSD